MTEPRFVIKWSPSVDRRYYNLPWQLKKIELFPPFLPTPHLLLMTDGEEVREAAEEIRFDDDIGHATVCRDLAQADVKTEKFSVTCWDECTAAKEPCDKLREILRPALKDEIVKPRDEFYEEEREEVEEETEWEEIDEEEEAERRRLRFPWLDMCKDLLSPVETEEEIPGTTDPYISHELYIPYSQMPKPRHFESATEKGYVVRSLEKRDRSPIRTVLPEKFNLRAAYEKWQNKHMFSEGGRQTLMESKNRISQSLMELSPELLDNDVLISSVVLQAVCEKVTLTLMHTQVDTDIHTFVNIAIIWALSELDLFTPDMPFDESFDLVEDYIRQDRARSSVRFENVGDGGLRRILMGVYRPPFSRDMFTTLHRRLPWQYMGPAHERGHMKLYPNIRERIQEKCAEIILDDASHPYICDVTCFHARDVTEKSYVAYTRRSKFFSLSLPSGNDAMENFAQLATHHL